MTIRSIGFIGISGVGKTTFIGNLRLPDDVLHLQASVLIQEERQRLSCSQLGADKLPEVPDSYNQALLTAAFLRHAEKHRGLMLLDGHVVIDTPTGLIEIPAAVFSAMGVRHLVHLQDYPCRIRERRRQDLTRQRPDRSEEEIAAHQILSLRTAAHIALEIGCLLSIVTPRHSEEVSRIWRISAPAKDLSGKLCEGRTNPSQRH